MVSFLSIFAIGVLFRILPFALKRQDAGVDHWYWLAYISALKKGGSFPPALPHYRFDLGQWYPPVFPLLLSVLPFRLVEKYCHWITIGLDLTRLALLLVTVKVLLPNDPWALAAAGLLYVTTPILVYYNTQLNSRGLGALLMDGLMVVILCRLTQPASLGLSLTLCFWVSLILLTHKMTTQVFVFTALGMSLIFKQLMFLKLLAGGILIAGLISGGFYLKVLRAHWDILRFWTREWPLLGADALKESPLYGQRGYTDYSRQYKPGLQNKLKRFLSILAGNYAPTAAGALLLVFCLPWVNSQLFFMSAWLGLCLLFAVLTVLVPVLRGLGFGNLYLYNAAFPAALILSYSAAQTPELGRPFVLFFLVLNGVIVVRSLRQRRIIQGLPQDVISEISHYGEGAWLSFPMQWMEQIAYRANKPVLWGAHGYGFEQLRQIFPVIRREFGDLMREQGLRFVLVDDAHLDDMKRVPVPQQTCYSANGYHILELLKRD